MAEMNNVTVKITAIDKVSPVLRRIRWMLWWYRYGGVVVTALLGTLFVLTFLIGYLLGVG